MLCLNVKMDKKIAITSIQSLSALGSNSAAVWDNYKNQKTLISNQIIGNQSVVVAAISDNDIQAIFELQNSDAKYKALDKSVLFAIYVSRKAAKNA